MLHCILQEAPQTILFPMIEPSPRKWQLIMSSAGKTQVAEGDEMDLDSIYNVVDMLSKTINQNEIEARESRKVLYSKIDEVTKQNFSMLLKQQELEGRLKALEVSLGVVQPTINEFVTMRERARGAGALGRWLWAIGGAVLTIAFWIVSNLSWLVDKLRH